MFTFTREINDVSAEVHVNALLSLHLYEFIYNNYSQIMIVKLD